MRSTCPLLTLLFYSIKHGRTFGSQSGKCTEKRPRPPHRWPPGRRKWPHRRWQSNGVAAYNRRRRRMSWSRTSDAGPGGARFFSGAKILNFTFSRPAAVDGRAAAVQAVQQRGQDGHPHPRRWHRPRNLRRRAEDLLSCRGWCQPNGTFFAFPPPANFPETT